MGKSAPAGECFSFEIIREGNNTTLKINCDSCNFFPSLEGNPLCMTRTVDKLIENPTITKVVFTQKRDYDYEFDQIKLLHEIGQIQSLLVRKNLFSMSTFGGDPLFFQKRYSQLQFIVHEQLKGDPISAYIELKRMLRHENILMHGVVEKTLEENLKRYISLLEYLIKILDKTKLIQVAQAYLSGYKIGDRSIYRRIFQPTIKPDFMFTRLQSEYPLEAEELDTYMINDTEIMVFKLPNSVRPLYHMIPPEFRLSEEKYEILDTARRIIAEHKPTRSEFVDPERMRQVFFNVGRDLIEELSDYKKLRLRIKEVDQLTNILVRYTVGFGLIELLLEDKKIQDITINSPMGNLPMFIVHADYQDCQTNIVPTAVESESWASKLRMMSGRPLDEANPVLDTELLVPGARARVAVVSPPLNPTGLAYAFRRHREKPWTLPLFIQNKMMSPLAAGLISFLVDGSRTMLVAGTRSAGKTAVLGAVMTEIMKKYRIITIEDTLELPSKGLRELGYNIQSMKVASILTRGTSEVSAEEGIRTTLRMGDSCLIVGEVRSTEASALYEAMRVGALANVVAGTIHGDSPYGVFDRVVNDLKIPATSFKATDIILVANPVKSADGMHRWRRLVEITEVGKFWSEDPQVENGFRDLMKYNAKTDIIEPTPDLIDGESDVLKAIAGNVKEWAGNWDAVWENIQMRAAIKEAIVTASNKYNLPYMLEAGFVIEANDQFHNLSEKVKDEVGGQDPQKILREWNTWLQGKLKRMVAQ